MVAHLRILFKDDSPEPVRRSGTRLRKFVKALFYSRASWHSDPSDCFISPFVMEPEQDGVSDARPVLRLFVGRASAASITGWSERTLPMFRLWDGGRDVLDVAEPHALDAAPPTTERPPRQLRLIQHPAHPVSGRKALQKSKDNVSGR